MAGLDEQIADVGAGGGLHAHGSPRTHDHAVARSAHAHAPHHHRHPPTVLGRSPAQAYGVGLLHGVGGSAAVGVPLLASVEDPVAGLAAL